ncbi:hypothetical protein TIFTF001_020240 [Ficus carica]|uniref:Uncharacterized protein n=1 Tax=Ficus carica TaxID=3494 RepID=A0AA88DCE8_FICCA|nr:hypothetical protein TIFTF001_020240 [Ficus carica]
MHLWPTRTVRESWKQSSMAKIDRTISKMRSQKRAEAALKQNLLENQGKSPGPTLLNKDESCLCALWKDFLFLATCCCCFGDSEHGF